MASRRPFSYPRYQAWGDNETFLNGGTIEFFDAGTSNNRNIYQDAALTTTAPNPVTLNSRGEPQSAGGTAIDIYLDEQPYKIVLKDSAGVTKHTIDNYVNPESLLVPQDPTDATDQSTDVFEGTLSSDPSSGEVFVVDFQTANTTTTPTFENTSGSLGALTIKTRDGSALWSGALNGVHELQYDGTDLLVLDPESTKGVVEPEHATDGGTDAFASATNTTVPSDGQTIVRDFQSANTTTTPTLDGKTMTTRDGSALWAGAVSGPHEVQYALGTDTYLVLEPNPSVQRDFTRAASATQKGDVELATSAETQTGTDTGRAVTPKGAADTYVRIRTASYTGDGTTSQSITGVGFQPKFVKIWLQTAVDGGAMVIFETTSSIIDDNANGMAILHVNAGGHEGETNAIISLDADGFTVDDAGGDNHPNTNGNVYNYLAIG